jgi:chromosome transmission fidelity protein 1
VSTFACRALHAGQDFPSFPYAPYDIQLGFMRALYKALELGGVGLFESPTGTGKTLSLICGALTWLQEVRASEDALALEANCSKSADAALGRNDDGEPDWMRDHASQAEVQRKKLEEEARARRLAKAKARLLAKGSAASTDTIAAHDKGVKTIKNAAVDDPEAEYLLDDWHDDVGEGAGHRKRRPGGATATILYDSGSDNSDEDVGDMLRPGEDEEMERPKKTQIIFCSRTHSQLTQFVGELHRTPFADTVSLVALGSRRALCINDDVLLLKHPSLINERCLEMQKPSGTRHKMAAGMLSHGERDVDIKPVRRRQSSHKAVSKCPYLASNTKSADSMRDMILAVPTDIEELAKLGRRKRACPYYASRRACPEADVILAPYSALLVEETRKALGLQLEGSVLIVDEAHNLGKGFVGMHRTNPC